MDSLHPILGRIIAVEDKASHGGLQVSHCQELVNLVDSAQKLIKDYELERELMYFKFTMLRGVEMKPTFLSLTDKSIVMISKYIF